MRSKSLKLELLAAMETHETDGDVVNECAVIMDDHLHWLFELKGRLSLGRVVAKLKTKAVTEVCWQRDFYDHRLRPDELIELYGRYIFMNPYRAKLCSVDKLFEGTRFWRPEHFEFVRSLNGNGGPQPEWLRTEVEHPVEVFVGARLEVP